MLNSQILIIIHQWFFTGMRSVNIKISESAETTSTKHEYILKKKF